MQNARKAFFAVKVARRENLHTQKHGALLRLVERAQMEHEILMSQRRCLHLNNHNMRKLFMFGIKPHRLLAAVLGKHPKMILCSLNVPPPTQGRGKPVDIDQRTDKRKY